MMVRRLLLLLLPCVGLLLGCPPVGLGGAPSSARPARGHAVDTRSASRAVVLVYHRITEMTPAEESQPVVRRLTTSPGVFASQMNWLVTHGYRVVSTRDIVHALRGHVPIPPRAVAITFDDGYGDNFVNAWPILRGHNFPATIFLVPGTVGSPRHVTWEQVRKMQAAGMSFGAHTVHHQSLPTLDESHLIQELTESRSLLEARLGVPVQEMAYPYGDCNPVVADQAQKAGYDAAWKMDNGTIRATSDPYRLPRLEIQGGLSLQEFATLVKRWE